MNSRPRLIGMRQVSLVLIAVLMSLIAIFLVSQPLVPALAEPRASDIQPAPATTQTVTSTADSGAGSLRQAIADANSGDTIQFNLTYPAVIALTSGQLSITKDLTIDGPGASDLTVSGSNTYRVFYIASTVTISGVTIADGSVGQYYMGGGIFNDYGTLTLTNSIIRNNTAIYELGGGIANEVGTLTLNNSVIMSNMAFREGGGIFNSSGTLALNNSILMNNTARLGGGISNPHGLLTLNNSTLMSNAADDKGGGIHALGGTLTLNNSTLVSNTANFGGGIESFYTELTLTQSTVASNTALFGGGGIFGTGGTLALNNSTLSGNSALGTSETDGGGALVREGLTSQLQLIINHSTIVNNTAVLTNQARSGIWVTTGTLTLTNSIVANNNSTNNFALDTGVVFTSQGYNLSNDWNGVITAADDLVDDPLLGPLADNGGQTWTHALLPDSPALDQIPYSINGCGTTFTTDQRGLPRPSGDKCDIGAYEYQFAPNNYLLTIATAGNGGGVVTAIPIGPSYPSGTVVTLTAMPLISSTFLGWNGDVISTTNPLIVSMNSDKTITATFVTYRIHLPIVLK